MTPIKLISGPVLGALSTVVINESSYIGLGAAAGAFVAMWVVMNKASRERDEIYQRFSAIDIKLTKLDDKLDQYKATQDIICKTACNQLDKMKEAIVQCQIDKGNSHERNH